MVVCRNKTNQLDNISNIHNRQRYDNDNGCELVRTHMLGT